jgi:capsular polysaccharide biosynthesis protein
MSKHQQSELSVSVSAGDHGQRFNLVDPASLPGAPTSPSRKKFLAGGLGAGLVLGLLIGVLLEMRKPTFHTQKEISSAYSVPLVIGIPDLATPAELRTRKLVALVEAVASLVVVGAVLVAEVYVYRFG